MKNRHARLFVTSLVWLISAAPATAAQDEHAGHGAGAATPAPPASSQTADPHAGHNMAPTVTDGPWSYKGRKNPEPYTKGRWDMVPAGARTGAYVASDALTRDQRCAALREAPYLAVDRATRAECNLPAASGYPATSVAPRSEQIAGAGHDSHGAPKGSTPGAAAHDDHWMAPPEAVQRKNPVPKNAASLARGKKIYADNCASCHGASGRGDGPAGKVLTPKPVNLVAMAGNHPDGDYAWKIENGRGPMPPWKGVLTQNQIWDVVNYVQSLGGAKAKSKSTAPKQAPAHDGHTGHAH